MSEPRIAEQLGRVLGGRYRLIAPIGVGASGEVYLADDTQLRRQVAVKVLHRALADDEVFLRRFRAEAQMAASLNHPHVVAVFDWGEDEVPFLVTEYLSGGSLRAMLDRCGTLSPSQALLVGLEASEGLEYAHRRGVVQRDIKPGNLLFDGDGHLRIADFGLAKALAEASATEPSGAVLGTVRYASPEQAKGQSVVPESDVYSLGLVLIEAITGTLPFDNDTPIATLMARVDHRIDLDDRFASLRGPVERAVRADPTERPDAGALHVALLAAAEHLPRPEPLPLAGAISFDPADLTSDQTLIGVAPPSGPHASPAPQGRSRRRGRRGAVAATTVDAPKKQRAHLWRIALAVILVAGAVGGTLLALSAGSTPSRLVPDAIGKTEDAFREEIADFWVLSTDFERLDGSTPGQIIKVDPEAGTDLDENETITITISLGNEMRTIPPDLVGRPTGEAIEILAGVDLVGTVTESRFDEDVAQGFVVEVAEQEVELPAQSTVSLIESLGPESRAIPANLTGLLFSEAESNLAILGLQAVDVREFSSEFAPDVVIAPVQPAGTEVQRDAQVELRVSKGPQPVTIPPLVGFQPGAAADALAALGLCVGDTDGPPNTPVIGTDPPAGSVVTPPGPCVRILTTQFG